MTCSLSSITLELTNMGKNYCNVEHKWCKFLRRGICKYSNCPLEEIDKCKRITEIETLTLSDLLKQVTFDDVFKRITHWFTDQEHNKDGYKSVFETLLEKTPKKHKLDDLFIQVERVEEDDSEWLDVSGINVAKGDNISYGIEFEPWDDWVTMFITKETLASLTKEDIVAGCLYEMTFFGFTEKKVQDESKRLLNAVKEAKRNG